MYKMQSINIRKKKKRHTYNCKIYKINVLYADFAAVSSVYPIKIPIFVI